MIKIINIKGDKIIIPNNAIILSKRYFIKREDLLIPVLTERTMKQHKEKECKKHYSHLTLKDRFEQTIKCYYYQKRDKYYIECLILNTKINRKDKKQKK